MSSLSRLRTRGRFRRTSKHHGETVNQKTTEGSGWWDSNPRRGTPKVPALAAELHPVSPGLLWRDTRVPEQFAARKLRLRAESRARAAQQGPARNRRTDRRSRGRFFVRLSSDQTDRLEDLVFEPDEEVAKRLRADLVAHFVFVIGRGNAEAQERGA